MPQQVPSEVDEAILVQGFYKLLFFLSSLLMLPSPSPQQQQQYYVSRGPPPALRKSFAFSWFRNKSLLMSSSFLFSSWVVRCGLC